MRIGIVRTEGSPCRCAESLAEGLRALGHEAVVAGTEEISSRAGALARDCDLVLDHADTVAGRGPLRPFVRLALEARGARLAGSDARACALSDDKAAARERLARAGVPVPPGVVIEGPPPSVPAALGAPLVVKPAHEHMSRGMAVASTREEAESLAAGILGRLRQPVLVERFVPGRELAVSVLAREDGSLEVLPPVRWRLPEGAQGVISEDHKVRPGEERIGEMERADLGPALAARVEELAVRAFRALGLRDYARFDVRVAEDGTPFFLEANTKPSLERWETFARSAAFAGMDYPALVDRILRAALAREGASFPLDGLPGGPVALWAPAGVHAPAPSSAEMALLLDPESGETAADLGCGCGVHAVALARKGARRTVAVDADPAALEATLANARRNGVADRVEVRGGSWFEALGGEGDFDLLVATPPQTPGPYPFGPRYGGPDGAEHLLFLIEGSAARLRPGTGRLWLLSLSLAHPARVRAGLGERFAEVRLVKETERPFTDAEMEALCPGLPGYLRGLRARGLCEFEDRPGGGVFRNLFWRAAGPRGRDATRPPSVRGSRT